MKKELFAKQQEELLNILKARFEKNKGRHNGIEWAKLHAKLDMPAGPVKLWSLNEMERTGGEPDVVRHDKKQVNIFFLIAQLKLLQIAEVFVMTAKH